MRTQCTNIEVYYQKSRHKFHHGTEKEALAFARRNDYTLQHDGSHSGSWLLVRSADVLIITSERVELTSFRGGILRLFDEDILTKTMVEKFLKKLRSGMIKIFITDSHYEIAQGKLFTASPPIAVPFTKRK